MEERELTALLQQAGDRVAPGPAPVRDILREGRSLRRRRSGRVRVFAVAAAAAAVVGGGSVAATVLDLPSSGGSASDSAAGGAAQHAGDEASGGDQALPKPETGPQAPKDAGGGVAAEDVVDALIVTPDVAQPGDAVRLAYRDETASYAPAWRLERRTAEGWSWEYTLASAGAGADPTWWPAAEDPPVDSVLVPYSVPIALLVPPSAAPGEYRICQEAGTQDLCGTLRVG